MSLDSANYIKELQPTLPGNTDPRAEGASQIRTSKRAVFNSFPEVDKQVDATADRMNEVFNNYFLTKGMIMMWAGDPFFVGDPVYTFPEGWALCNGEEVTDGNGLPYVTPDLRGKFIMGYTSDVVPEEPDPEVPFVPEDVGEEGGANYHDSSQYLQVDEHILTVAELPPHDHDILYHEAGTQQDNGGNSNLGLIPNIATLSTELTGGGEAHDHDISAVSQEDNRPAYYVLAYIVYIGIDGNIT